MSGTFSGFSEEDIRKLKSGAKPPEAKISTDDNRKFIKAKRRETQTNLRSTNKNVIIKSTPTVFEVPENAKLSIKKDNKENGKIEKAKSAPILTLNKPEEHSSKEVKEKPTINSVTIDSAKIEKRVIDLDEFQARQKLIEEQNRKRKELLSKALADRTKQTEEEAKKLKGIQSEFRKLDALLSNDVSILRHQIEIASLEFMEAQKKYHRVEKEFLDAKLSLHQKLERKEMLTEHLCAIIEKNEERKAQKLSELIERLEVDVKSIDAISENSTVEVKQENGANMIDEVKNRREVKIDLNPEKNVDAVIAAENESG